MKPIRMTLMAAFASVALLLACDTATDPAEEDPPNTSNVCTRELCATNSTLADECQEFLAACLLAEPNNEDECVGGALLICEA
jgi:hypothetical protein